MSAEFGSANTGISQHDCSSPPNDQHVFRFRPLSVCFKDPSRSWRLPAVRRVEKVADVWPLFIHMATGFVLEALEQYTQAQLGILPGFMVSNS